jgi:Ca-activated chloride channel family protein
LGIAGRLGANQKVVTYTIEYLLKTIAAIWLCLLTTHLSFSQYYLRGEIKDEKGNLVSNAKLLLHSTGYVYYSGSSGGYGIMSTRKLDSLTISGDGFQSKTVAVNSTHYEYVVLKMLKAAGNLNPNRLISFTKDLKQSDVKRWSVAGETYTSLLENQFVEASSYPETGFAVSIDKASYSNVRRFLNMQAQVPPDAVRIEELLNYFTLDYREPPRDSVFHFEPKLTDCPWDPNHRLMFLKMSAKRVNMQTVPPSNLVFLIDISGSMDMPNRLPLLKSAFKLMVNNLRSTDTVSIVIYGGAVGVWLTPTGGDQKAKIIKAIEELEPGGATPGASGIGQAYQLAKSKFIPNGNNRVILATDGDFNVGQTSEADLENMIAQNKQSGIYLTCLGVGMGNYKDSKLEVLAKKGNGNFAYLDSEAEAQKVLVKELTQTLYSVADDAYMGIRFNPDCVQSYRLIGFDNKRSALSDSTSKLEGGEVGSGHALMAVFEIVPTANPQPTPCLATVSVNYKCPRDSMYRHSTFMFPYEYVAFNNLPSAYRFATAVVMFGEMLKESKFTKNLQWNQIYDLADASKNPEDVLQAEFVVMVDKARKMYTKGKKKKGQE